jgi:hypothetical protein
VSASTPVAGVDTILARCLLDPEFLRRVSNDPGGVLAAYDLDERARRDFESFDFGSVRNFAGFITKIQHNDLWESLPGTRSLLKHYEIEIETFTAYHPLHAGLRARRVPRDEKIAAFLDFLQARLAAKPHERYPGLRDVLVHERLTWEIRTRLSKEGDEGRTNGAASRSGRFDRLVPAVRGVARVGSFEFSPFAIAEQLAQGRFEPSGLSAKPHSLVYWGDPVSQQLRVFEVDEVTAAILREVDGRRSVGAVVRRATRRLGGEAPPSRFRPLFETTADRGLLALGRREDGKLDARRLR